MASRNMVHQMNEPLRTWGKIREELDKILHDDEHVMLILVDGNRDERLAKKVYEQGSSVIGFKKRDGQ